MKPKIAFSSPLPLRSLSREAMRGIREFPLRTTHCHGSEARPFAAPFALRHDCRGCGAAPPRVNRGERRRNRHEACRVRGGGVVAFQPVGVGKLKPGIGALPGVSTCKNKSVVRLRELADRTPRPRPAFGAPERAAGRLVTVGQLQARRLRHPAIRQLDRD